MASSGYKRLLQISIGAACTSAAGFAVGRMSVNDGPALVPRVARNTDMSKSEPFHERTLLDLKATRAWDYNWDKREPKNLVKQVKGKSEEAVQSSKERVPEKKARCSRHLLLIRHGQYDLSGETDSARRLTPLGWKQAALLGRRLQELQLPYNVLINSTMQRAKETADELAMALPNLPRQQCELIREGAPYPPEPAVGRWKPQERFFVDGARIEAGFRKHFHRAEPDQEQDSYEIIVCHANVIRYYICRALQLPPEAWLRMSLNHASVTHVVIRPDGRCGIKAVGECGFIPKDKVSVA